MSFWDSRGIRGVGYDVLEGSDGKNERLRWVQGRIQLRRSIESRGLTWGWEWRGGRSQRTCTT